jgi:hypothetical protein
MRTWVTSLKSFTERAIGVMSDYITEGVDLTMTEATQTRLKIECNTILNNYKKVYESMLARLSDEEEHGADIELSTFQIVTISSVLDHLHTFGSFGFTKSNKSSETSTVEINLLKSFLEILKATPPCMTTFYLRDYEAGRAGSSGGSGLSSPSSSRSSRNNEVTLRTQFLPSQVNSFYR